MRFLLSLFLIASLAGCLAGDDAGEPNETIPTTSEDRQLETQTFSDSGTLLLGAPTVSPQGMECGMAGVGAASHDWEIPAESEDGIAQRVRTLYIELARQDVQGVDVNLYLYDASGELVADNTDFDPVQGYGGGIEASDLPPGTYTIEVRSCMAAFAQYELEGAATMVAIETAGGSGDDSGYRRGQVDVSQRNGRWVATRVDSWAASISARTGDAQISTGAGFVSFSTGGSGYALQAELIGQGETEQEARAALDAIEVAHELDDGSSLDLRVEARVPGGSWQDQQANFEFTVTPSVAWDSFDVDVAAGSISIDGIEADGLSVDVSAGSIEITDVLAKDMMLDSSAGSIDADMKAPQASGRWQLDSSAGSIDLRVVEGASVGYDVDARTSAGSVTFRFDEAPTTSEDCEYASCHKTARTEGYDDRPVKTSIDLSTSAGSIEAGS